MTAVRAGRFVSVAHRATGFVRVAADMTSMRPGPVKRRCVVRLRMYSNPMAADKPSMRAVRFVMGPVKRRCVVRLRMHCTVRKQFP